MTRNTNAGSMSAGIALVPGNNAATNAVAFVGQIRARDWEKTYPGHRCGDESVGAMSGASRPDGMGLVGGGQSGTHDPH
jgi:hypothetical protein